AADAATFASPRNIAPFSPVTRLTAPPLPRLKPSPANIFRELSSIDVSACRVLRALPKESMLPKRAILACLIVIASLLCHASPVTPAEAAQWREDLRYFAEQAPQVHKNLFHSMAREQFETAVKNLDERIPSLSRNQVIVEITRIVAMIGDGHTYVELQPPPTNFRHYPLKLYWFADGVYIVK